MERDYYFLVSMLADYQFDSDVKGLKLVELRKEIELLLSASDRRKLVDMYWFYDLQNIIAAHSGAIAPVSGLGNMTWQRVEELVEYITAPRPSEEMQQQNSSLPSFVMNVVARYSQWSEHESEDDDKASEVSFEKALYSSYYKYMEAQGGFLAMWYSFDRELRNIAAAYGARQQGADIAAEVVGEGDIVFSLVNSALPDFGLKGEIDYLDTLFAAIESDDILEKERKVDLIRWQRVEEINSFNYFNISFLLGYMVQLGILYRWIALDRDKGRELFKKMIASLSDKSIVDKALS